MAAIQEKVDVTEFWSWFSENESKLQSLKSSDDSSENDTLQGECIGKLHEFDDGLFFEIGGREGKEKSDFIITAEGNKDLFSSVEKLVGAAPDYDGWNIVALKPALGAEFKLSYEGLSLDPNTLYFMPLKNEESPNEIGLRIGVPDFIPEEEEKYIAGMYLILDAILGEKSNAIDIGYLEVDPLPDGYTGLGYIALNDLPEFIRIKKS